MAANAHLLSQALDEDSGAESDVPGSLSRHHMNNEHARSLAYRNLRHSTDIDDSNADLANSRRSLVTIYFFIEFIYFSEIIFY